jgi:hypothetical protein
LSTKNRGYEKKTAQANEWQQEAFDDQDKLVGREGHGML